MYLSIWSKVTKFLKKAWEATKKLPKWALLAGLLLLSLCWYLFRRVLLEKKRSAILGDLSKLATENSAKINKATEIHDKNETELVEEFEEKRKVLEEKEDELDKEIAKGPVEIANAWKDFISEKK
jgi:hypothetical protein